jgi:membrane protease YdiL (CAAX protease family)
VTTAASRDSTGTGRVDVTAVAVFLAVAFAVAWLVAAPLWLSGTTLTAPSALAPVVPQLALMMLAPSVATLVVVGILRRRPGGVGEVLRETGLRSERGIRGWWRWGLLAWIGPLVLSALAVLLAAAVGVLRVDLVGFSGMHAAAEAAGATAPPGWVLLAVLLVAGWLNVLPALAEEWGWRGWLLPALLPWGRWPAILAVGVVWGLWHAPVVLLGYNYPLQPAPLRLLLMVGFCVVVGSLLGWLRLRSGSVWPCAIGHAFLNAVGGLPMLVAAAGSPVDTASAGLLGWTGWVVMLAALGVAAAVLRGRSVAP